MRMGDVMETKSREFAVAVLRPEPQPPCRLRRRRHPCQPKRQRGEMRADFHPSSARPPEISRDRLQLDTRHRPYTPFSLTVSAIALDCLIFNG